jgi:hypothetical protein
MVNISNLFEFCNDSVECRDVLYSVGNNIGNTLITIAIKNDNNHIYTYSNEWLYLIKNYYPHSEIYPRLIDYFYKVINNKQNVEVINYEAISFITCFTRGTVHGYTGIFTILYEFINNIEKYKNKKILVSVDIQQGILDLIYHLCNRNIIDRNNIIFIPKYKVYHFTSITFIPNWSHTFGDDLANKVTEIINRFITPDRNDQLYYNSLNIPTNLDKICIIKGTNSHNITSDGIVPQANVINFANSWGFTLIEPNIINEICLIHCINQCRIFVTTWGTAFLKNFVYISDKCEKIIVLVIGDNFIGQYNSYLNSNTLKYRHKNANIVYRIIDLNLNFNPNE